MILAHKRAIGLLAVFFLISSLLSGCNVINSVFSSEKSNADLEISEVVSSNSNSLTDAELGNPDWIELYNASDKAIKLSDYSVATDKSGRDQYKLPDIELGAGKYLVIYCCPTSDKASDKYCTGFKLPKSGVNLFILRSGSVAQELTVPELQADVSYGLTQDGTYKYFTKPTPGAKNDTPASDALVKTDSAAKATLQISEVLPKILNEADGESWLEIHNTGKESIELSDYCISDNASNPTKAHFPKKKLEADGYAVFKCTGNTADGELPFKIGGTETTITLSDGQGAKIDSITWSASVFPGISVGRDADNNVKYYSKPTPAAKNGTDVLTNTSFALKEGVPTVRINEILKDNSFSLIDSDGDRSSWVELYNTSDQPASLLGYVLSDNKSNIWKWIFPDVTIQPKGYLIVYLSGKDRKTGDELHTNFGLGSSDENLVLTDSKGQISQTVPLPKTKKENVSYGMDDKGEWQYFPQPTPLAANNTEGFKDIAAANAVTSTLKINEVQTAKAAKSNTKDWVEIYNTSSQPVNLTGYYLSDSKKNLKKWGITSGKVSAGGYAVVNSYKTGNRSGYINISGSGEALYLSNAQGMLLDVYKTGVLRPGYSSGIIKSGNEEKRVFFNNPTPGKPNSGQSLKGYCGAPVFSVTGGYQSAPFTLTMTVNTKDASIYYTTDGSKPSTSSTKYTGPIKISSNKVIRAIASASGFLTSDQTCATYFFNANHSLPVVCLSISEGDLKYVFGSAKRDDRRERAGYVEYYEGGGKLGVSFPAGFRIAGNGTRSYAQKSINLYLRGGYGKSSVTYPFFEESKITTYKSLSLRDMGQDISLTRMRDAYFGVAANGLNIENMQAKFCVVYINGKYWGLYEFKQNQNEDLFAAEYGIDTGKVEAVRGNTNAYAGSNRNIKSLFALSKRNTADDDIFKTYTDRADSDYFMDYIIAQTFFCNSDFYNQKYAHTTDNKMKWRPLLYDLDWSMMNKDPSRSIFSAFFRSGGIAIGADKQNKVETSLFYAFYKNPGWRDQFVKRYAKVLNTVFTTEKLLKRFDDMADSIEDEMSRTVQRWGKPSSVSKWKSEIAGLRRCLSQRRKYAISSLKSYFNVSSSEMNELFPND